MRIHTKNEAKCSVCKGFSKETINTYIWKDDKNHLERLCSACFGWAASILNPYGCFSF